MDRSEDILDVTGLTMPDAAMPGHAAGPRPWVGIRFDCCGVYARVYRNQDASAYCGRCPRCMRQVRLRVGPDGTSARFFRAE